jgi:hypothetical protein
MPKRNEERERPNNLRQIMDDYNLTTQKLITMTPLGGATINTILRNQYYPGDESRQSLVLALSKATDKEFTEQDVWPEV